MSDKFNVLDYTAGPLLKSGQLTDYTPAGRTTKDDGGFQRGIVGSKVAAQYEILTTGQYSGSTNITVNGKTDVHSNACVFDKVTSLMWSRTYSASVYGSGTQDLFWSQAGVNGEDIFNYCDAANTAAMAGFTDWRIPNIVELYSTLQFQMGSANPNTTAFPVFIPVIIFSSTTNPADTTAALAVGTNGGIITSFSKTSTRRVVWLCRLGVYSG